MAGRRALGRRFGWLWASFAVSSYGTGLGFGAFSFMAILVLHSGPTQVAVLAASGRAVGALVAVPLGPWVEFRRKRPVMIAMDLTRFGALLTIPVAFAFGLLTFAQLLVVSVVVAAANIAFSAASGSYLKALVPREDLLVANSRFESTTWTSTMLGPPLGGVAIGLFGPVTTVVADAVSYLLSALGIRAIGGTEPRPERSGGPRLRAGDLLDGWRYILAHPTLRPLLLNAMTVNGLIMAAEPLLAVLLLGHLGFSLAVRPRARGLLRRRGLRRLPPRAPAGGPVRAAQGDADLRDTARVLADRPGVRPPRAPRDAPRHRRPARPGDLHRRLQPPAGHRPPRTHGPRPGRPHPDRLVGQHECGDRGDDGGVGVLAAATTPRTAIAIAGVLLLASPLLLPRREHAEQGRDPSPTSLSA